MLKSLHHRIFFSAIAAFFLLVTVIRPPAFGYGGNSGGSEGNEGGGVTTAGTISTSAPIKPLTAEDIKNVFTSIGPGKTPGFDSLTVSILTSIFEGQEMTIRDLMTIRQAMLEGAGLSAAIDRIQAGANLILVQILDGSGQIAQIVLTIVPGVGWGTNAALGIARSGADEIKKGSDISTIGGEMILDGTVSLITKGLPLGDIGDAAINKGVKGITIARGTISATVRNNLVRRGARRVAAGVTVKVIDQQVSGQTKDLVRWTAEQVAELGQTVAALQDQNQVSNLAPPADSFDQTLSVPASNTTDGLISFP